METAERALLEETARAAIGDAAASGRPAAVDRVLADLGWLEMLETEPRDAIDVVFDALGTTNGSGTPLDDVLACALGARPRADLAVLLPPFAAWTAPGRVEGEDVLAVGVATARVVTASEIVVVCGGGSHVRAVAVPVEAVGVEAVHGIDPDAGLHAVKVEHARGAVTTLDATAWDATVALGRRAIARQIAGASRTMLELACSHAVERVQFGRPIARFQAVRHRLAEAFVAVEALEATLTAAGDEPGPETAALAKAVAGRTARTVGAHCQQVLAGIGFTTDHPFHRYLKRTMVLDGLLGSADDVVVDLGRRLVATRTVPTLIEL
jgi:hypothetical protein